MKEHFVDIDAMQVLARVVQLPISTWNYKSQDAAIRHIGPAAQDFFAAFKVGDDERHITEIDEGGVALAAIQGLNQKLEAELKAKDAELAEQQRVNERQEQEIRELMQAVEKLRRKVEAKN
jgi:isoaspartyl peptidase/L-asparaginase-like protein (Ntn-hydrolase superfamily)